MASGTWPMCSQNMRTTGPVPPKTAAFLRHALYKIETIISKNDHLFSTANISFQPLLAGERVLKFALLPNLRVSRVVDDQAQDIYYVSREPGKKTVRFT